jgi:hypothetical protein
MKTLILIFISFCGFCQIPETPKFNPVVVTNFNGAPARYKPIISSNIKFWISPNSKILVLNYDDDKEYVKVVYEKDTGFVFSVNFTKIAVVQDQVKLILDAERKKTLFYENIIRLEQSRKDSLRFVWKKYQDSVKLAKEVKVILKEQAQIRDYTKKLYAKYYSLNSPLALSAATVSYNSIGIPEANLTLSNISGKDIDAYEVSILCYDNYNRPVNHYLYKTNVFKGLSQQLVEPTNETSSTWTLYGYENTTKITVILKSVHYKGKNAWYPKNKIFVKSE